MVPTIAPVSPLSVRASAGPKVIQCPLSPHPGAGHLPPSVTHCLWSRDRVAEAMCGGVDISRYLDNTTPRQIVDSRYQTSAHR